MALNIQAQHLALAFGLLGNLVSFMVFLAPLPTFHRIFKKKSTEDFQSIPYSVALFSSMLMLYYAFLKTDAFLLITINSIGVVIESIYLIIFLIYAPKNVKINTTQLLVVFNIGVYVVIVASTYLLFNGDKRVSVVGWICVVFSISVFAAPLSIIRRVIRTKSVEFMPISLSFSLTLCAVVWFFYGFLIKDYYIAAPNILGFAFGIAQMVLYVIYKDGNKKKEHFPEFELPNFEKYQKSANMDINIQNGDKKEANLKDNNNMPSLIAIIVTEKSNVSK